jgi:F-type H+-transporting ATPase subunit a
VSVYALKFPEIYEILVWPSFLPGGFNKIALLAVLATVITLVLFLVAGGKDPMTPPKGVRNFAESLVEFVQKQLVLPTMGPSGLGWTPFLLSFFCFIFLTNIPGIIPTAQMPANARMAGPMVLALLVWFTFIGAGLKHHGLGYFKEVLFPPGVPKALYILVTPIEILSTFLVRPFSLAVRLFANLLAGHILLVTFAVLTDAMFFAQDIPLRPLSVFPFLMLTAMTAFEVLVAFLQAYIFTILAAVYIGGAVHPEH